jgi:AraC-like DNA-binding protein
MDIHLHSSADRIELEYEESQNGPLRMVEFIFGNNSSSFARIKIIAVEDCIAWIINYQIPQNLQVMNMINEPVLQVILPFNSGHPEFRKRIGLRFGPAPVFSIEGIANWLVIQYHENFINAESDREKMIEEGEYQLDLSQEIKTILDQLASRPADDPRYVKYLTIKAREIFIHLAMQIDKLRNGKAEIPPKIIARLKSIEEIIRSDLEENFTVEQLARKLGTNSSTLKTEFRKYYRIAIHQLIGSIKMAEAEKLILEKDLPLKDIIANLGFKHESHFFHRFKKHFGITPGEMRSKGGNQKE